MFFDEAGWGRPAEPAPKRLMTARQERLVMRLVFANLLFMLVAPIGGGTILQAVSTLVSRIGW
ncbi:hypothetical protein P7D22_08080 [Lichenihabitans sp. Uapishka_5]|uniref:hypothetical protein n=1 Tax=Lichenihabitans sp. Uapishka_5 TaxID=3037302 RepID=UPI0029E803A4|nr:hypothetical protein [Lichenihabitans sp. Uapishka_5]MDX7951138.1 hypothetical protein [Lichenihabitans sp. Uapishka_5]